MAQRWQALLRISCAVLGVVCALSSAAAAEPYREDAVKAAFLYRFTGYVDWPAPPTETENFTIAVLGGDAVADELRQLLTGRMIKDQPARVRSIRNIAELGDAQMLYVGASYAGDVRALTDSLRNAPLLVVTDRNGGLEDGGMINFLLVDRRVRFEISLTAANRAGLKVKVELLSVATRVMGAPLRSERTCLSPPLHVADIACVVRVANR